jgi:hypothetical protein
VERGARELGSKPEEWREEKELGCIYGGKKCGAKWREDKFLE